MHAGGHGNLRTFYLRIRSFAVGENYARRQNLKKMYTAPSPISKFIL